MAAKKVAKKATKPAAKPMPTGPIQLEAKPLTPARWPDLERLFGEKGACGGCWCMWWRLPASVFTAGKGNANRKAFKKTVEKGPPPGLIAYAGKTPVGWIAIGPRKSLPRLANSRTLAPVDDKPVWSVSCFFVTKEWRKRGLSVYLIEAATRFAAKAGARLVEGYPVETRGNAPAPFVWTGLPGSFTEAGFEEVARRSKTRPILRRAVTKEMSKGK
jgi:GNAT superfamily N-acetyltransferase